MKAKLLPLLLFLLLLPALAAAQTRTLENDALLLAIDDETLDIYVTIKDGGRTFFSGVDASGTSANASWQGFLGSSLVLEVSQGTAVVAERVDVKTAKPAITYNPVENGADLLVDFTERGQRVPLEIRLYEDSFSVTVPGNAIEEYGESRLCGLYLLPCFGASRLLERQGYILVPEAAGAIINFSDGKGMGNTPFSKRVYGGNAGVDKAVSNDLNRPAQQITLPLYGMAYTDEGAGFLAVVEKGDAACEILAYPGGVITDYNWAAARFTLREEYTMQTTRTQGLRSRESEAYYRDMSVRFYLLGGEEATYAGMARRYRKALEEAGALKTADTAYRPRLDFLGAESEKFLLWDNLVPMTTAREALAILEEGADAGLTAPLVIYRGWQKGGLTRNLGSGDIAPEGTLGALNDLDALKNRVEEMGGQFLLETDPVLAIPERMYNMRLDVARTIGQTVIESYTGMDRYPTLYYLTPGRSADILANYYKAYAGRFPGVALSTLSNVLYSYYSAGINHTRGDTMAAYQAALSALSPMTIALKNPLAAYYPYMDAYLDMPLGTTSYSFLSAQVPFLPLVLNGRVPYYGVWNNFASNQQRQLLKMVEYGAFPSYLITAGDVQKLVNTNSGDVFTAKWDILKDTVLACDGELSALHGSLGGAVMTDHRLLAPGVAQVRYDSGARLIVNYNDAPYAAPEGEVPALGYLLLKGEVAP